MTTETIVAVYDTAAHADNAVRDLEGAGVQSGAISRHTKQGQTADSSTTARAPAEETGFWASLFGSGSDHQRDREVYDRSLQSGSTVVTVNASEQQLGQVMDILERHNPIDIDEQAAAYGTSQTTTTTSTADTPRPVDQARAQSTGNGSIQLAEEKLAVGKRAIDRGTTRVRRYVVETPVEEQVSLREETVSVDRHPVTDGRTVTNPDFSDKVIEMTETDEEAVVSKTARVTEEIEIHKDVSEHTDTVHETLRHHEVEVTKDAGSERATGTAGAERTDARTGAAPASTTPKI